MKSIFSILSENKFSRQDIVNSLSIDELHKSILYEKAYGVKLEYVGNTVYYRGIIEFSYLCEKNCYYCGIRKDNKNPDRYRMDREEIIQAAKFAQKSGYCSPVLQSGEIKNAAVADWITSLLRDIKNLPGDDLGITLSLCEQI